MNFGSEESQVSGMQHQVFQFMAGRPGTLEVRRKFRIRIPACTFSNRFCTLDCRTPQIRHKSQILTCRHIRGYRVDVKHKGMSLLPDFELSELLHAFPKGGTNVYKLTAQDILLLISANSGLLGGIGFGYSDDKGADAGHDADSLGDGDGAAGVEEVEHLRALQG